MSDLLDLIDATHREIGDRPVAAGEGRSLLVRRSYDAPVADLWRACTDPDRLRRWLAPVTGDLRPGGAFSVEGHATGTVVRCEEPNLLEVTWEYSPESITEVEVRLAEGPGGGTVLELEHASPAEIVDGLVRAQGPVGPIGIGGGWDLAMLALHGLLHDEDFDVEAWRETRDSRRCAIFGYRAWGAASQAAWGLGEADVAAVVEFAIEHFAPAAREDDHDGSPD